MLLCKEFNVTISFGALLLFFQLLLCFDVGVWFLKQLFLHTGLGCVLVGWIISAGMQNTTHMGFIPLTPPPSDFNDPKTMKAYSISQASRSEIISAPSTLSPLLPRTLMDWRKSRVNPPRQVWDPLEAWFASQGFHFFEAGPTDTPLYGVVYPPNDRIRTPDSTYSYKIMHNRMHQDQSKAIHCFAQTMDGRHVLIRLIAKGDRGLEELDIQRRVATSPLAFLGENHTLPMLQELTLEDMTFGVFPAMCQGFDFPWYYSVDEVFDVVIQLLEGLNFLHRHLIAHRDISPDNILINFVGGQRPISREQPFRSLFPVRYYFIDFELSVRFPEDSRIEDRIVTGLPIKRLGLDDPDDYGRDIAPEMLTNEPYDPFKTDMFQIGKMFYDHFCLLEDDVPELIRIFEAMTPDEPSSRITAAEALNRIHACEKTLTREQLALPVREAELPDRQTTERLLRRKAKEEAKAKSEAEASVAIRNAT